MTPQMQRIAIGIPDDLKFSDLKMSRDPVTGDLEYDTQPILRISEANDLDPELFLEVEDNLSRLITMWYLAHLANGGEPDPVQEQLRAEVEAEDQHGAERVQFATGRVQ